MGIKWENASYADYLKLFDALSNPIRLRILGILHQERQYVSELARLLNISRPLLYMHLRKLEDAGLVEGSAEISSAERLINFSSAWILMFAWIWSGLQNLPGKSLTILDRKRRTS